MKKYPVLGRILLMSSCVFGLTGCYGGTPQPLRETPQAKATAQHPTLDPTTSRPSETSERVTAPPATLQPIEAPVDGTPPSTGSRQIIDNDLSLREYWRVSAIIGGHHEIDLCAVSGRVVYREFDDSGMLHRLRALEAASGSLLWETPWSWKNSGPLAADPERVYYSLDFKLRVYSLAEGVLLWETEDLLPFRVMWMSSDGKTLSVRGTAPGMEERYFDVYTGENLGYTQMSGEDGFVFAQFPSFYLYYPYSRSLTLQAIDVATQQVLWMIETGSAAFDKHPELFDDTLLIGAGQELYVLDVQTGQIKWQNQGPRFANWLTANDFIYALDYNARLIQLDIETGKEIGYVQFAPATDCLENGYCIHPNYYLIAADGQMFFVYFGDRKELIALGP